MAINAGSHGFALFLLQMLVFGYADDIVVESYIYIACAIAAEIQSLREATVERLNSLPKAVAD